MEYSIEQKDLQKILDYLVSRPFSESASLVQLVMACKPIAQITPAASEVTTPTQPEQSVANG